MTRFDRVASGNFWTRFTCRGRKTSLKTSPRLPRRVPKHNAFVIAPASQSGVRAANRAKNRYDPLSTLSSSEQASPELGKTPPAPPDKTATSPAEGAGKTSTADTSGAAQVSAPVIVPPPEPALVQRGLAATPPNQRTAPTKNPRTRTSTEALSTTPEQRMKIGGQLAAAFQNKGSLSALDFQAAVDQALGIDSDSSVNWSDMEHDVIEEEEDEAATAGLDREDSDSGVEADEDTPDKGRDGQGTRASMHAPRIVPTDTSGPVGHLRSSARLLAATAAKTAAAAAGAVTAVAESAATQRAQISVSSGNANGSLDVEMVEVRRGENSGLAEHSK
ncbi:hypothetical protein V8E36_003693 [Tilletia maclaganii]